MIYRHRFQVRAPVAKVVEFHRRSASLAAITPFPIAIRVQRAPDVLTEGDEMEFTIWIGPLPVRWLAHIEDVSPTRLTYRQLNGPFDECVHHQAFVIADAKTTEVVDEITLEPRIHPGWWFVGLGIWLGLPILFAYRQWKTRRILE